MADTDALKDKIERALRAKQEELGLDSGPNLWPGTAAEVAIQVVERARGRYANTRFLMIVEGRRKWMTFEDCYRALDAGFMRIVDGGLALDIAGTGEERPLTAQEKFDITDAADEFSGSK